jgi:hypothetical protein
MSVYICVKIYYKNKKTAMNNRSEIVELKFLSNENSITSEEETLLNDNRIGN